MASLVNRVLLLFVTYRGEVCKTALLVLAAVLDPKGNVLAAIRTAIEAISAARSMRVTIGRELMKTDTASDGPYEDVEDKACFTFVDASGGQHLVKIPCPKDTIFLEDKETVDLANLDVVAFILAMVTSAKSAAGEALTACSTGRRIRTKTQRR